MTQKACVSASRVSMSKLANEKTNTTSPVEDVTGPATLTVEQSTSEKVAIEETDGPRKSTVSWLERLKGVGRRKKPPVPEQRLPSKEASANLFSVLAFHWIAPLMHAGYRRPLELNDIWLVNPSRSVNALEKKLNSAFQDRIKDGSKQPLLRAMYSTFKRPLLLGGFFQLLSTILMTVSPYVLKYLIAFASKAYNAQRNGTPDPPIGEGVGLVFAISGMQVLVSISINQFFYFGATIGGEARAVLMAMIFDKALKISGQAKAGGVGGITSHTPPSQVEPGSEEEKKWYSRTLSKILPGSKPSKGNLDSDDAGWSNGRIVNLMSTDTWRIDQASGMFHMAWASPLAIIITLALLVINLSYSALPGVGLLFLSTPLLGKAIRALFRRRAKVTKITDQRVSLTQEILQAVRFVKYFGWETSFLQRINDIRKREIKSIRVILAIRDGINAISMSMPVFAAMLSFITFSMTKNVLTPAPIFSSLAMFNGLRMPLNFLPLVIGQIIDGYVSVKRIQEFLLAEEASEEIEYDDKNEHAVNIEDASFTWERTNSSANANTAEESSPRRSSSASTVAEPFQLRNINLKLGRGELVAVIGTVGSGKTSLLEALAGNMRKTHGQVTLACKSRAFCPQYAWIQNATVRENIVFGKPFDADWYGHVLDACALRPDLAALPDGDMTEIGERGITVSGGQKQRINVARAIYCREADFILMDDPLSAVDAHVGRHIMERAVCDLLAGKCRILATHQLHVLHRCDQVVWMRDGRVEAFGTFDGLMAQNDEFAKLMTSTSVDEEEDKNQGTEDARAQTDVKEENKEGGEDKQGADLMQAEDRAVRSVSWRVYSAYLLAAGSIMIAPLVFVLLVLAQATNILTSLWLSWWTAQNWDYDADFYIGVYAGLGVLQVIFLFLFSVSISILGTQASKVMLYRAMVKVLRAPMSFFDTTPLGRITNRLSKDIDVMDNDLTDAIRMYYMTLGMIVSVFVLIISYYYYFAIALAPLVVVFLFAASYYRRSAIEIKRHESVLRSTVFAKFSEAVYGTATIRAYGLQGHFSKMIRNTIDDMDSAYFLTFANQRWLSIRLDAIGNMMIFIISMLVVTSRFNVNPSIGGVVLSYILGIVGMFQFAVRQLAEVENNMNSTERIHHYGTGLEEEAPLQIETAAVRSEWPEHGEIVFDDVQMRYRAGLPLVLKGLTMHVAPGERIGIVGRTGAGKSSIIATLFRIIEVSGGSITIDGVDISRIGLHDVRSRMAIIPQDPTLFKGTVRANLDPFNEHTDLEMWSALRQAGLADEEASTGNKRSSGRIGLESVVQEEGLNFSLGQRQLMALARALVRGSRIIICDEATSSVDFATDLKIQQTMMEGFKGKTLLCIAHRLRTIIGYDRICVMDQGRIAELGAPLEVFDLNGIFRGMCDRGGVRREDIVQAVLSRHE
ncbi:ABC transporter [Thelonectria olida]|uniref:ABC transporter n=1 Tax=Thelonectria olida TaxID=1576542 RepID=A0A9P8W7Z5_9HYPO|nr:ABC transporter [Thelonectria olida]